MQKIIVKVYQVSEIRTKVHFQILFLLIFIVFFRFFFSPDVIF